MVSKSHQWLHQFQLVTEHSLKGATNYSNRATSVDTKHAVLRPRPRPGSSGLKTETLDFRSRDQDRDLGLQVMRLRPRPGQNELESRDHGLEITTLVETYLSGSWDFVLCISLIIGYSGNSIKMQH